LIGEFIECFFISHSPQNPYKLFFLYLVLATRFSLALSFDKCWGSIGVLISLFVADLGVSFPSPLPSIFFVVLSSAAVSCLGCQQIPWSRNSCRACVAAQNKKNKESTQQPPRSTFRASQASCGPA
jgi:hypothetical protein